MSKPRNIPAGQLSLFGDDDQPQQPAHDPRPLPIIVAERWDFVLQHHIIDGDYWFSVQDWIAGLVGSDKAARITLSQLKKTEAGEQLLRSAKQLPYTAKNKKTYQMDFAKDTGMYLVAQYTRDTEERPVITEVRKYLSDAGAFADLARREPEAAGRAMLSASDRRKRKELTAQGWSEDEIQQWLDVRSVERGSNIRLGAAWKRGGITEQRDYAKLNNTVSQVATGETATQLKTALQTDTPREGLSAVENAAIHVVQSVAELLHTTRHSHGMTELVTDIQDTDKIINRDELMVQFGKRRPKLTDGGK